MPRQKKGEDSCPFNSLYWNFLDHHRAKLSANPRMGMMYRLLDKKDQEEMQEIRNRASKIIENPDLF
jgi:deoxyribodipyrimidine photolyase-related protein